MHFAVLFDFQPGSAHIGEAFHSFCEVFDDFICVAVLDAVAHAVLDVCPSNTTLPQPCKADCAGNGLQL